MNQALTRLYLGSHQPECGIPSELGDLAQLRTLEAYSNTLTGPIPPQLGS